MPPKGELAIPKPPPRRTKGRQTPTLTATPPLPSPNLSIRSQRPDQRPQPQQPPSPQSQLSPNWVNFQGKNSTLNRPLPPPPVSRSGQSTPVEPALRTSVFDSIKRPPSIAMEKIKTTTAAALDRMVQLQQRYRQHQETMRDDASFRSSMSDRNRDQGSSLNGSMSSGMDAIPFRPPPLPPQRPSAFEAVQPQRQFMPNPWQQSQRLQTQSMAQLNFMPPPNNQPPWHPQQQQQQQQMWMNQHMNRSNMSLNVPAGQGFAMDGHWGQGWGNVYPYPMYPYPGD